MNRFEFGTNKLTWTVAFLLAAVTAGCNDAGRDSILGAGGAVSDAPTGSIVPGALCGSAGVTIPTVTSSDPVSENQTATTSTAGVAGNGKLVTATFSLAMAPSTINATTFTLKPTGGSALTPASVSYNALTKTASLTTTSALQPGTSYTAIITQGVTSDVSTPLGCIYAWRFKTAAVAAVGLAPVDLGLATPFGMASTAGVTNTPTAPNTNINGDVVLANPTPDCGGAAAPGGPGTAGFGLCGGNPPTLNGTVITPTAPDTTTANAVKADMNTAFLSICAPGVPDAGCSLGGATSLPAGTTLGAPTGNALVLGDNWFTPGVYQSITSILITDDLTLDAQGDPNAAFIFQSSSTIDTADGAAPPALPHARILLVNGAKASNVFWQASSSATLGLYSEFQGNILAAASITMKTGATSCGRLFAGAWVGGGGAFVFDSNVVSVPGQPFAPPAGYSTACQ